MPDHPSIQGLREAINHRRCIMRDLGPGMHMCATNGRQAECYEAAQAAYLSEHGVLLSGEGLVRAERQDRYHLRTCAKYEYSRMDACDCDNRLYRLVPVPQDGER